VKGTKEEYRRKETEGRIKKKEEKISCLGIIKSQGLLKGIVV